MNAINEDGIQTRIDQQIDVYLKPLLQRMITGDELALADFYDRTIGHVYGLALRITGRADAAEEVAGDVYLQAWREAARYQPERARVLGWLMMICRSRSLDHMRRRDQAELYAEPELLGEYVGDDDPAVLLERSCTQGQVRTALKELTEIQRRLIGLAFFRGMTHQEISTQTQLPLGTVKAHIRRGMLALQILLSAGALQS